MYTDKVDNAGFATQLLRGVSVAALRSRLRGNDRMAVTLIRLIALD
jgi:hypothetical protein